VTPLRMPQVAQQLGLAASSLRRLIATDPEFPVIVLGPRTRIVDAEQLQEYLAKRRQAPQVQHIPAPGEVKA
jgi:predicted DNA-binding transcriptional regulator AlpA